MVGTRPYTVATLAERWQCSEQHIRDLINRGELPCFRAGRLIRITAAEVGHFECGSNGIVEAGTASIRSADERAALPSEQKIVVLPSNDWRT